MSLDYKELLRETVQNEYDSFLAELKKMSAEEVMEHAYEKVIKDDLAVCIENGSFSQSEAKALCRKKYPLDFCYREWLDNDLSHMEMLRDTVSEAAEKAYRDMKAQSRESR